MLLHSNALKGGLGADLRVNWCCPDSGVRKSGPITKYPYLNILKPLRVAANGARYPIEILTFLNADFSGRKADTATLLHCTNPMGIVAREMDCCTLLTFIYLENGIAVEVNPPESCGRTCPFGNAWSSKELTQSL
jgi:hypothetical protein